MKTIAYVNNWFTINRKLLNAIALTVIAIMLWQLLGKSLQYLNPNLAQIDAGIVQLILLAIVCYLIVLKLAYWLINQVWKQMGLPELTLIISQFNHLSTWQQLKFYWASFALLLSAAVASIVAIL